MSPAAPEQHVRMGELALANSPTVLKTTLGSCVGIALIWRARGTCALAHCLLPYAPGPNPPAGARYVDQALASMLRLLQAQPQHHAQLEAHLAGGANMGRRDPATSRTPMVGQLNLAAALQQLQAHGIAVHTQHLGGLCARTMRLDCRDASVAVSVVAPP